MGRLLFVFVYKGKDFYRGGKRGKWLQRVELFWGRLRSRRLFFERRRLLTTSKERRKLLGALSK